MCEECKALYKQLEPHVIPITEALTKDYMDFMNLLVEKYGLTLIAPYDNNGKLWDLDTMEPAMKAEWHRTVGQATIAWLNAFHAVQMDYHENLSQMIDVYTDQGYHAGAAYAHHQKGVVKN